MLTAAVVLTTAGFLSVPALAAHCPKDVKVIDATMKTAKLSTAQMAKVKSLRDDGDKQHKAGQHGASIKSLHEALGILGKSH